jgi:CBS domain-containing protein
MAQTVRDVMTEDVVTVQATDSLVDAARRMREADIGDVIVMSDGDMWGVVTDRDIVVRAVADGMDPRSTTVGEIATKDVATVKPDDPVDAAIQVMRERAVRRVPVVTGNRPIGIVSIGDLAIERDEDSALAQISAAEGNN